MLATNIVLLDSRRPAMAPPPAGPKIKDQATQKTVVLVVPKYVREHKWKDGKTTSYHWAAPDSAIEMGFLPDYEKLGTDPIKAFETARGYLAKLDKFRSEGCVVIDRNAGPAKGLMFWLKETYVASLRELGLLKEVTIKAYEYALRAACEHEFVGGPHAGTKLGDIPVSDVDRKVAKQFQREFLPRPEPTANTVKASSGYLPPSQTRIDKKRQTHTRHVLDTLRSQHNEMQGEYPEWIPAVNPWANMRMKVSTGRTPTATPEMTKQFIEKADKLAGCDASIATLVMAGQVLLDRAMCLPTELTVADYRPSYRPDEVRVFQSKTGEDIWMPLKDADGSYFFPQLVRRLDVFKAQMDSGPLIPYRIVDRVGSPWTPNTIGKKIRDICDLCDFPKNITFRSFRKGGLVQSGEAGLTHTQIMGQSGHASGTVDRYVELNRPVLQAGFRTRAQDLHQRTPGVF